MGLNLFGGGDSASSTTSTTVTKTNSKVNNSQRVNDMSRSAGSFAAGNIKGRNNIKLVSTDLGAVRGALKLANKAVKQAGKQAAAAQQSANNMLGSGQGFALDAFGKAGDMAETFRSDGASQTKKTVLYLGLGLLAAGVAAYGFYAWSKK